MVTAYLPDHFLLSIERRRFLLILGPLVVSSVSGVWFRR